MFIYLVFVNTPFLFIYLLYIILKRYTSFSPYLHSELYRVKEEMQRRQQQMSSSDSIIRQLQAREEDLTEELGAKNSQLAVLRVRLQEADGELKAKSKLFEEVQSERNRYGTCLSPFEK